MTRPITTFPARMFLDQPGKPVARGFAVRRAGKSSIFFQPEGELPPILVREEFLLSAYDIGLSSPQIKVLDLIAADERGYAFEYRGDLPGTTKKPVAAEKVALAALLTRGVIWEDDVERYKITDHGKRVRRVHTHLMKG